MSETTENIQQTAPPPPAAAVVAEAASKPPAVRSAEEAEARTVAQRYRLEYVDMETAEVDYR
ncbi:MAG TPA: hypothetical protein VLZ81_14625, partial [Blastocatellia bacterium]|nr:hypothetical protein [Blastocatellia bacterium]